MTKLHEKTLIDIEKIWWKKNIQDEVDSYDRCIKLVLETVKEWQIAKIKNCDNILDEKIETTPAETHLRYIIICGGIDKNGKVHRCQSCQDRMKDYEISDEMLCEK